MKANDYYEEVHTMTNMYTPESAMAIVAHPDDIEFTCAGTLARWARAGARICYVICTSGDAGIDEPGMTRARAAEIREAEARQAAKISGVQEVVFLHEPDGMLVPSLEVRKKLVREVRRFRPEVVITGDPTSFLSDSGYINHPDHRAAATAALDAISPGAGQPNLFEELESEGLKAHKVRKVYVMTWEGSSTFVNIEETMDVKIKALRAHKSQMKDWDPEGMLRQWAEDYARGKEMRYAEGYRVFDLVSDEDWEKRKAKAD